MNKDILKGQWKQLKGQVKQRWGRLTDDDLTAIEGGYDELVGRVQEAYGIGRDEAMRQVRDWELDAPSPPPTGRGRSMP